MPLSNSLNTYQYETVEKSPSAGEKQSESVALQQCSIGHLPWYPRVHPDFKHPPMKAIVTVVIALMAVGSLPLLLISPILGGITLITAAAIAVVRNPGGGK